MDNTMDVDVLIVGGGSAGLSAALHLRNLIDLHNGEISSGAKSGDLIPEKMIVVIEKASEVGGHSLSGAVMDPSAILELCPKFREEGFPIESDVNHDEVRFLTSAGAIKLPVTPPPFDNHGNMIVSLSKVNRWLGAQCEAKGINIFPGFAAVEVLYDNQKVIGVRTGDKGRDKNGKEKANFEPGLVLKSQMVIFAEGSRGSLFKQLARKLNLFSGKNPETFEEGVKEIIQMPPGTVKPGQVIHMMGYPLKKSIGGSFLYTMKDDKIALGLVAYLDTHDPFLDPHRELQRLKTHPWVQEKLKNGKVIAYGGKTIPAGGWYSMPKLFGNGFLVVGDSASMVDTQKLKGIHLAMKSGMLAAEVALLGIQKNNFSEEITSEFGKKVEESFIKKQLFRVRNFHQTLSKGMFSALPFIALQELTGGRGLVDNMPSHSDAKATDRFVEAWGVLGLDSESKLPSPDGKLLFDKLGSVYLTGTSHDEDSPNHLLLKNPDICRSTCEPEYKSPCNHFCPAAVYEMVGARDGSLGKYDLQINYTNCIHCKTCDIKCPFENIEWTAPEGGGGPRYQET